jgi:hypothetical protein
VAALLDRGAKGKDLYLEYDVCDECAEQGLFKTAKALFHYGAPMGDEVAYYAVVKGDIEALEWAVKNGSPVYEEYLDEARDGRVKQYLKQVLFQ